MSWALVLASKAGAYLKSAWLVDTALKSLCHCVCQNQVP